MRGRGERRDSGSTVFLLLGELFLIPHLLPIAVALARTANPPRITILVITSIHREIVAAAVARAGLDNVSIRNARGYRRYPAGSRLTPRLPHKLLTLLRNAVAILRHDVAVVAERTSLWLPRLFGHGTRFVYNEHGAGPHANFAAPRNRAAARILMPGDGMAERARATGPAETVEVVGYVKRDFRALACEMGDMPRFAEQRPTVVYVPHWLPCKSSWWTHGEAVLDHFARCDRYNLILAPHIRLPRADPKFEARVARFRGLPNIHVDGGSFALVDQRYLAAADIYLGDGSSQVVEYCERPRPVLFLDWRGIEWQSDPRFSHWSMGEVVDDLAGLDAALARAAATHPSYAPIQHAYVARMMGPDDGRASIRAAAAVREVVAERVGGIVPSRPVPAIAERPLADPIH